MKGADEGVKYGRCPKRVRAGAFSRGVAGVAPGYDEHGRWPMGCRRNRISNEIRYGMGRGG